VDLVYIDRGHTYNVIKSDTENALKIIANHGIIVWDDYGLAHPDVKLFLDKLSFKKELFLDMRTGFVFFS